MLGWLGIFLPIVLVVWSLCSPCGEIQESISAYYYTPARNIFIGILCGIALFLVSYTGFPKNKTDYISENALTNIAGFLALGVAFFPTSFEESWSCACHTCLYSTAFPPLYKIIHLGSAVSFFSIVAYISYKKFTYLEGPLTDKRKVLHAIYKGCGITIAVSIVLMVFYFLLEHFEVLNSAKYPILNTLPPIFILETIALWAFGSSWLIKGKAHIWLTYGWRIAKHKVSKAP